MVETRKQNVSIRMNASDLKKVKELSKRLAVRESDVLRFAIKSTLSKLAPLYELDLHGSDLLPVFMDFGAELTSYFDFDSSGLENIINGGVVDQDKKVLREDIDLLSMSGKQDNYVALKLKELANRNTDVPGLSFALREYLMDKYVAQNSRKVGIESV